jgi:hypothetical protein
LAAVAQLTLTVQIQLLVMALQLQLAAAKAGLMPQEALAVLAAAVLAVE